MESKKLILSARRELLPTEHDVHCLNRQLRPHAMRAGAATRGLVVTDRRAVDRAILPAASFLVAGGLEVEGAGDGWLAGGLEAAKTWQL